MLKYVFLGDTLLNDEPLGIQRVAYELLKHLDEIERDYSIEVLVPENVECKLDLKTIPIVKYGKYNLPFLWRQINFPKYVKKENAISIDFTLGLTILSCGIVCLYDSIYENCPEDFIGMKSMLKRLSYILRAKYITKHAKRIITASNFSRKELIKSYPSIKHIDVISCGWQHYKRIESDNNVLEKYSLHSRKYLFSLGSSLPHKNFEWIIRAAIQNPGILFVVTGTNRLSQYQSRLDICNVKNVIFTGFLTDGEVKALMENCMAFVQPSKYEGFGIPPLEALSCGAKVLCSNSTCLPEIFGNSVIYFDPNSENIDIARMLSEDPENADALLNSYDWAKSAQKLNSILEKL